MKAQIEYGKLGKSNELETFITEHTEQLYNVLDKEKDKTKVWLKREKSLESRGEPLFSTNIEIVRPHEKNIFVHKNDVDFLKSIKSAFRAVRTNLMKG